MDYIPWTQNNTEGHSDAQLAMINNVKRDLVAGGLLNSSADDLITQALPADTEDELRATLVSRGYDDAAKT